MIEHSFQLEGFEPTEFYGIRNSKIELIKSIKWLSSPDVENLRHWVMNEYGKTHSDIIKEVFCLVKA